MQLRRVFSRRAALGLLIVAACAGGFDPSDREEVARRIQVLDDPSGTSTLVQGPIIHGPSGKYSLEGRRSGPPGNVSLRAGLRIVIGYERNDDPSIGRTATDQAGVTHPVVLTHRDGECMTERGVTTCIDFDTLVIAFDLELLRKYAQQGAGLSVQAAAQSFRIPPGYLDAFLERLTKG
jgi:hypothetical protein